MDRPSPAQDIDDAIRAALRRIRAERRITVNRMEREIGVGRMWLYRYDAGTVALADPFGDARKFAIATAYPELVRELVALSLAWLPDDARARLTLAWAPATSGDGE